MITGPSFIWLHFPKCGGTEVAAVLQGRFGAEPGLRFDEDGNTWHHSIAERRRHDPGFDPAGRAVIVGFRRLPGWLLSRVAFEHQRNPQWRVTREMFREGRFFEASGAPNQAEDYARKFSEHPVTSWIRTEHLEEDFVAAFAPHLRFDPERIRARFRRRNATTVASLRNPRFHFTPEELRRLYDANPTWRDLERRLYGATLAEQGEAAGGGGLGGGAGPA